jgi:hypothetical protein
LAAGTRPHAPKPTLAAEPEIGRIGWIADLRQIPCRTAKFAPIPDNITGRQRKPHSRTAHTIGDETAGLAARRKTQIFEAVANGGGLSYMHSGMYGRGSVRQMRSTAPPQIPGTKISVCRGVGGMFTASGTIIMSSRHSAVSVSIAR